MEKTLIFASEQWLLLSALAAAVWALAWFESRLAGSSVTPHALTSLVNQGSAVIVDLRDKPEFDTGHIVGSINMPFSQWQSKQTAGEPTELDKQHDKLLVLVCKMGQQSSHVAKKIQHDKFKCVYRLSGGITEWQSAQMPLVKT